MIFDEPTLQEQLDEEFEMARLNLEYVDDIIPVWMVIYEHQVKFQEFVKDWSALTTELLQISWGDDSWADVDLLNGMIYYRHKDGREISRLIAF